MIKKFAKNETLGNVSGEAHVQEDDDGAVGLHGGHHDVRDPLREDDGQTTL